MVGCILTWSQTSEDRVSHDMACLILVRGERIMVQLLVSSNSCCFFGIEQMMGILVIIKG